jgi:diguanylate cyclase (GGDEF)-like protein/PAS domain S-box-containing protein
MGWNCVLTATEKMNETHNLPGIRTTLTYIVLACLIPTVLGFAVLMHHFYQRERAQFERDTILNARAMVLAVDRDLNSGKMAALALATSPNLVPEKFEKFYTEAKSILNPEFPGFCFVLSDENGRQLINTLRPFGEQLPMRGDLTQAQQVFRTGQPVISDMYTGSYLQRHVVSIDVPVWQNGKVAYSLAVGYLPQRIGQILTEQRLTIDKDRIAGIADRNGVLVARSQEAEKFVGHKVSPKLLKRLKEVDEGAIESVSLEGIPLYSYFSKSPATGWTVAIGVPKSIVRAELLKSIAWVGLLVIILCIAGFTMAWKIGGTISRTVRALATTYTNPDRDPKQSAHLMSFKEAAAVEAELLRHQKVLQEHTMQLTHDIAERQRVEAQLNVANQHLADRERFVHAVTDNIPGLVAYWDAGWRCRFANKQCREWFDKAPDEIRGMSLRILLGDHLFDLNKPHLIKVFEGESQNFERAITKRNGETMRAWINYIPDFASDGKVVGMYALIFDVTKLKQAEDELRVAATAFESNEAMMITDANQVVIRINRAFSEVTGYAAEEIIGLTPRILKSDRHDQHFYNVMWKSINQTGAWEGELWDRRKNGEIYPSWTTVTAVKNADGRVTHYVATQTDITARKASEEEIRRLAYFDALTGLPNRRLLMDRLRHAMANCIRSGRNSALMFIDLDNFKNLNDTQGHDKGDMLLQQVAKRLALCVREGDTVARIGGDEFVVMLENLSENVEEAGKQTEMVGEEILTSLSQLYDLAGLQYRSTSSIGVTLFTDHQCEMTELLKRADIAMYQAKAVGRNALRFFDEKIQSIVTAHIALDTDLRQGLEKKQFLLYFQAQVDRDGRMTGVEALVRWQHPKRGLVQPTEFIPLAEETGLILPLGHWVLEAACMQLAKWSKQFDMSHLTIAVNVSSRQFRAPDYVEQVLEMIQKTGANPHKLKLEITESLLLEDVEDIIQKMTALQAQGIRFSLDDFGIGYSSLAYLKRLPLDQMKIDQSFVRDVLTDHNDAVIACSIIALGQSLGLEVNAEGVETEEQRAFLASHHCDAYQGYLFSRPLPLAEFEQLMRASEDVA